MAILKPDKSYMLGNGLVVNEYLLTAHNPNKISLPAKRTVAQPLIGVTLHNTPWINVAAGTTPAEQYTHATYNGNMGDARVHWYTDNKCAWRNFDDAYTSWRSATGGQGQGNCNTISIECIMRNQTDAESVASMENTAKLIAWIFGQYGWTVEKNLYTHNYWTNYKATGQCSADLDAQSLKKVSTTAKCFNSSELANKSGKYCPAYILPQWEKFKALVKKYMTSTASATLAASANVLYRVQVGAYSQRANADSMEVALKAKGYDTYLVQAGGFYKVQIGAYSQKTNADNMAVKLKSDGFDTYITTEGGTAVSSAPAMSNTATIYVGSTVKVKQGAKTYDGKSLADYVYTSNYNVIQINDDRVVIGKGQNVTAAVKLSDLIKV